MNETVIVKTEERPVLTLERVRQLEKLWQGEMALVASNNAVDPLWKDAALATFERCLADLQKALAP